MKTNRIMVQILVALFLTCLPGIAGAAGPDAPALTAVQGVSLTPEPQTKYIMTKEGAQMSVESGKVSYALKDGSHFTFVHGDKLYEVTAKGDVQGFVTATGTDLSFINSAGQLIVVPFVGGLAAAPMTIAPVATAGISTAAIGGAAVAGGAAAIGAGVGLSGGHGGSTPTTSAE